MTSELVERAKEVGGTELAKQVALLEDELERESTKQTLNQRLKEHVDYSASVLNSMSAETKKELLEEFESETTNAEIPVPGQGGDETESIKINRESPDTYTREVEIPAPGQRGEPKTMTKEYEDTGNSAGDSVKAKREFHQMLAERKRRQKERAKRRREEQESRPMPTGYTNIDEVDADDKSGIPVPGQRPSEDDN